MKKEIVLLITTLIILFVLGEIFFRIYYYWSDKPIAADNTELCFKEMKNPNNYNSTNPDTFRYRSEWDEDEIIGLVPRKNHRDGQILGFQAEDTKKWRYAFNYGAQFHNSQGLTNVEEFSLKKPANTTRIAVFGDSYTCGAEEPLKLNVASVLKELVPNIEVLNFCMIGHGIDHMYARYVLESKQYSPDVVMFIVLVDDLKRASDCPLFRPNITISNGRLIIGQRKWKSLKEFYNNYAPPKYESYLIKHVLWVYDTHTRYKRAIDKGFELFKTMLDELKIQTKEQNVTLVVVPLLEQEPNGIEIGTYKKMMNLIKEKKLLALDSVGYLYSLRSTYGNQSFYYIREQDHYKHFSQTGNAVFAQGLKILLERAGKIPKTPNYYFANFDENFLYLIPQDFGKQAKGQLRVLLPFDAEWMDSNFSLSRVS